MDEVGEVSTIGMKRFARLPSLMINLHLSLHRLSLSATSSTPYRLMALTQPDRILTKEIWDHTLELDGERLDRLERR